MALHVPVGSVGRGGARRWPVGFVAAGPVLVAIVALAGGSPPASEGPAGEAAEVEPGRTPPTVVLSESERAGAPPARPPRRLPATLACEDLRLDECVRVARAAMAILPDDVADVSGASVWRSLRCGDTPDCPPEYLGGSLPLGSVILQFADGSPAAAINVVDWRHGEAIRLGPRAWLVEWLEGAG